MYGGLLKILRDHNMLKCNVYRKVIADCRTQPCRHFLAFALHHDANAQMD